MQSQPVNQNCWLSYLYNIRLHTISNYWFKSLYLVSNVTFDTVAQKSMDLTLFFITTAFFFQMFLVNKYIQLGEICKTVRFQKEIWRKKTLFTRNIFYQFNMFCMETLTHGYNLIMRGLKLRRISKLCILLLKFLLKNNDTKHLKQWTQLSSGILFFFIFLKKIATLYLSDFKTTHLENFSTQQIQNQITDKSWQPPNPRMA